MKKPNRDELEEKSNKAIEKAMTVIQSTAEKVNSAIKNVKGRQDHVEVEFGIKFDAEVGVILAKASMEASLNVTLMRLDMYLLLYIIILINCRRIQGMIC
jgi:hypothetical protein